MNIKAVPIDQRRIDQRVNGITLAVKDLKHSCGFYYRLGWRQSSASNSEIAFFDVNGLVLSLYPVKNFYFDQGSNGEDLGFVRANSFALSQKSRLDVDVALKIAANAGATKMIEARDRSWGGRSGYFSDPDGHVWEVLWNPNFSLDESGRTVLPLP